MASDVWQIVLVDVLFLCIAAGVGLWVRSFLREERREFDQRLERLDAQRNQLERLGVNLQRLYLKWETQREQGDSGKRRPEGRAREDEYEEAWKLLEQGRPPGEVARRLRLGVAEVELMSRILRHKGRP